MKKLKILAIVCMLLMTTNVHAALQSRPGLAALKSKINASDFFKLIREMEAVDGTLGLNATFAENSSTKAYEETSTSNNIDAHMCKNTEWGAVAMLSASEYGAGNGNVKSNYNSTTKTYGVTASTTGNMTGVFGMSSGASYQDYTAAGAISIMNQSYNKYLITAPARYVDNYVAGTSQGDFTNYIPGDATYEMKTFSGGGGSFVYKSGWSVFTRGASGILYSTPQSGQSNSNVSTYACIWVGNGI